MLETSEASLNTLAVHAVGTQSLDEGFTASNGIYELNDELESALFDYFLKPFKSEELFKFHHESELSQNPIYSYCSDIFKDSSKFHPNSVNILRHLYDQSQHPHIKRGEVYVAQFKDLVLEGELVEAVGIFKSEKKASFLQTSEANNSLSLKLNKGIDLKKLDKGCLVFNTESESGYRVMLVDQNNYDTQYWKGDFLGVEADKNEKYLTKNVINLCNDFSNEIIAKEESVQEKAKFMAKSIEYLQDNEQFSIDEFKQEVFADKSPQIAERFFDYKSSFEKEKELRPIESFDIVGNTVKQEKKKIKNVIDLDTNIQIKLNFKDSESNNKFIERGYDSEKEMYYYKVFFKNEKR